MTLPTFSVIAEFAGGDEEIGTRFRGGFRISRGSLQPSLTGLVADPGEFEGVAENFDRALDPTYTSSAYYPDVRPNVRIRVTATWASTPYALFRGPLDGFSQKYGSAGLDQYVPLHGRDVVSELAQADVTGPFPRQLTGARIAEVLLAAEYTGTSSLDAGTALVPAVPAGTTTNAWALVSDAVACEWGYGFAVPQSDEIVFYDRHGIAALGATSLGTFGDQTGELPYDDIDIDFDKSRIVNAADLGFSEHGASTQFADGTSTDLYGKLSWSQNIPMASGPHAISYTRHVVYQYKDPTVRVSRLRLTPADDPTNLWPIVLGLDPGQSFTVKKTPIGGGPRIERTVFVRGFEHTLDDQGEWSTVVEFDDTNLVTVDVLLDGSEVYDGSWNLSF